MFGIFRKRITQKLNTVNLGDDLEDVEMLQAIEATYGIKIEDAEAEALRTVGQLYELIDSKLASRPDFDPVWALTCQIVREHSGSKDLIDGETTFFPKHAKKRLQTVVKPD